MEGETLIKEKGRVRKVRSDKKRDVKPTVHISLYECISRLSYITNTPMKDVAEYLCVKGLDSREVIEVLSSRFRRAYQFQNTLFTGDLDVVPERVVKEAGIRKRLPIRFSQDTHDRIGTLAYSLDLTISSTTALLLETSTKNVKFLDDYIMKCVNASLDPARKEQLKKVFAYVRKNSPYPDEVSLASFISYILSEMKETTINATRAIGGWLDQKFRDNN